MAITKLSTEERGRLDPADFADPGRRMYPVLTQEDADEVARLAESHARGTQLLDSLADICKRRGLKVPAACHATVGAEFSLGETGKRDDPDRPGHVIVPAPVLFRCGDYPDKEFSLTPEEADTRVVPAFKVVPLDLEHKPTVLDGKLGFLTRVNLSGDDPSLISGEVSIPKWLDGVLSQGERKLSAAFHRRSKQIVGCGLVRNPRVTDAAMMAAFARATADGSYPPPAKPPESQTPPPAPPRVAGTAAVTQAPGQTPVSPPPAQQPPAAQPAAPPADFSAENAQLKQQVEQLRAQAAEAAARAEKEAAAARADREADIARRAVEFADAEILIAKRALPAERDALISLFCAAARDDFLNPTAVPFGSDQVTRLEALMRTQRGRQPHNLTGEVMAQGQAGVVTNSAGAPAARPAQAPMSEDRRKQLLAVTQLGRRALERAGQSAAV